MESYTDIGSLQIQVLRILWRRGDGTVHEVLEEFPPVDRPAYTTILHVLRTLERRGLVAHTKQNRQHRYRPLVEADDVEAGAVHSLLSRMFSGSAQRLVARLLEAAPLDPRELESIHRMIEAREAEIVTSGSK
ncbi:MAG: BlaI/MecI/CopY family transcriptional regulator [Armatimonadetes bacterium]|nr:BlaI/MecI/CopY family transcriptional regulator [Armatimonadota bacterium]